MKALLLGLVGDSAEQIMLPAAAYVGGFDWVLRLGRWQCVSKLKVAHPGRLSTMIADDWHWGRFKHAHTDYDDGHFRCIRCSLKYEWHRSALYLDADFKKTSEDGTEINV
jgi:hypothetical protein